MNRVLDNPADFLKQGDLLKQCELRRFGRDGAVERSVRWLPEADAVVGRSPCGVDAGWEIVSAPDPALPARAVRLFESAEELVRLA